MSSLRPLPVPEQGMGITEDQWDVIHRLCNLEDLTLISYTATTQQRRGGRYTATVQAEYHSNPSTVGRLHDLLERARLWPKAAPYFPSLDFTQGMYLLNIPVSKTHRLEVHFYGAGSRRGCC